MTMSIKVPSLEDFLELQRKVDLLGRAFVERNTTEWVVVREVGWGYGEDDSGIKTIVATKSTMDRANQICDELPPRVNGEEAEYSIHEVFVGDLDVGQRWEDDEVPAEWIR